MPSAPTAIGPFHIERELGRGGMGVVYLAHDTRLDRSVAIKALPDHLVDDADRLARFQREAKTLASLNHPNIAAIYGLESHERHQYLVLEYVEGETLADVLKRGPVPVDEALGIAKQIAEALEAAHEKGVIHRDIKPGNVIITPEGVAKVLDFGLARSADGSPASSSAGVNNDSPTLTTPHHPIHSPTIPGAIMGTAGYMSPEQARGKPVDKRSDIFSFGCVLFEMLSGARPFTGETVADALGATLHKELEVSLLPPNTPARIRELLTSCLAKDRRNRLHDIGDARIELERAIAGHEWTTTSLLAPDGRAPFTPRRAAMGAVAAAVLLGIGWLIASMLAPAPPPPPQTVHLTIPSRTSAYFAANSSVISPDGKTIAFSAASAETRKFCLWVRALDSDEARPLRETEGADIGCWSWDSKSLTFHADGKLWAMDVAQVGVGGGGGARRLIAVEPASAGIAWGPTGVILMSPAFANDVGLVRIAPSGGAAEPATTLDAAAFEEFQVYPMFLRDGSRYIYLAVRFDPNEEIRTGMLFSGRLDSTKGTPIAPILSKSWIVDSGWLVYIEDGVIKAAPFDLDSLTITGKAITIADGAFYFKPIGGTSLSVSRNGVIAFEPPQGDEHLVWFDEKGQRLGTLRPSGRFSSMRISPDGSQVAIGVSDLRTGGCDLWLYGTTRATATRLTTDARWEAVPNWSRDGATLYFSWDRRTGPEIYSIPADGSGPAQSLYGPGANGSIWFASDVSPDGKLLAVNGTVDRLAGDIRILPLDGSTEATPFRSTPANEQNARFAPDGHRIAYTADDSGVTEVYIAPYLGPGARVQVSDKGGYSPVWSPAGDRLYYIRPRSASESETSAIMVVDLTGPDAFKAPPPPRVLFETPEDISYFDITPDGKRFLLLLSPVDTPPIHVILNGLPGKK